MMRTLDRVAVVGGGGVRVPLLLGGLLRRAEQTGLREVALYDPDETRLQAVLALGEALRGEFPGRVAIEATPDLRTAMRGARFVFSAVRVGGEEGRILDERIPLRHGLLGQETTGIGGLSMALRSIPVVLEIAEQMAEVAEDAWLLNFTNPSGLIVEALQQAGHRRVVGLCDAPSSLKSELCRFLGVEERSVSLGYQGLNHLGWVQSLNIAGADRLPELLSRADDLCREVRPAGFFGPDLIREVGAIPNEYLFYYYFRSLALRREQDAAKTRGEHVQAFNMRLYADVLRAVAEGDPLAGLSAYRRILAERRNSYMQSETETSLNRGITEDAIFGEEGYEGLALRTMMGLLGQGPEELVLNVPSLGMSPHLGSGEVGELTCTVQEGAVHPQRQDPLPPGAAGLVRAVKDYELWAVRAAIRGSRSDALQACLAHPLIGDRTASERCLDDLLAAHRQHLPRFSQN